MTAPDQLDPYTARALFTAGEEVGDPQGMVSSLLEDIARRCEEAGASLIGHIKCHARVEGLHFHCNLTSLRRGARCGLYGGEGADAIRPLQQGDLLELDLAVLVYGLPSSVLEALVSGALAGAGRADVAQPSPGRWTLRPFDRSGSSEPDAGHHPRQ